MKKKWQLLIWISCFSLSAWSAFGQRSLLQAGPMVGYSEMREVQLWVQTNAPATVQIGYWPQAEPGQKHLTEAVSTAKADAYTAHLVADEVEPGQVYTYELLINGQAVALDYPTTFQTQALWQWRTDPPEFTFALGSCFYANEPAYDRPGKPYGGEYQIFESIFQKKPDLMLWLGDNVYLREADWFTRTGILARYTHMRSTPELQPLLASVHHYAIWDDHDFGPDDSDRSFIHKEKTREAFRLFWANPTYGLDGRQGITTFFQWADADFFLLDNRYFRTPNGRETGERTMLGKEQLEWLIDALAFSRAPFKFVAIGGQVLSTAPIFENYASHHAEERAYLLKRIEEEGIRNVIFLSGDRHHTELSKLELGNGEVIYDLTVSPLTSGVPNAADENNALLEPNTAVWERNFGTITVSGPRKARKLTIRIFNADGEELWTREVEGQ